ncbi:GntR family transcriptional regulator [Corynebacterium amycolatum]|uniref:GntR family transcriptional regulator n=1 Tax=Corynebacterium amycolatum TaxID=43765 RepID=UPI002B23F88E|nr:GntR family transcriptional regulator [Corynebacterium amycolatum]MEB2597605.1 GntR family transcriptional regulator [Corynebacterium amycolatum]
MTTPGSILDDQTHTSSGEKQQDVSVADVTATVLRREILAGKHYSGEQLRETQLAARLQVSRNTIRQVYRKLESEGLLTHIPHHGVFIASFDKQRIRELYAFRHVAECGTLRSLSKSQAKLLGEEILSICGSQSSLSLPERNNAFHLAIVRASGSPDLLATAESIQAQLRLCFLSYPQSIELHARYADRHISIAKVLIEDTPNHAADLLSAYLNESFGAVTAALPLADRS